MGFFFFFFFLGGGGGGGGFAKLSNIFGAMPDITDNFLG